MKASRRSVDYSPGQDGDHCAVCKHYYSKHSVGHCDKVEDPINSYGWCRLFAISGRLFGSDPRQE